jgi:hypothetical protein
MFNGSLLKSITNLESVTKFRKKVYLYSTYTFLITAMLAIGNFLFTVPINNVLFVWVLSSLEGL